MVDGEDEPKYLLPRIMTLGDHEVPIDAFVFAALSFDSMHRPALDLPSGERIPQYPNPHDDEDVKHFYQVVSDMTQSAGGVLSLTPPDMKEVIKELDGLTDSAIAEWANKRAKATQHTKRKR